MTDDTHPDDDRQFEQGRQDAISTGAKIRGKIKRGNGTRDQDELVIEGRGGTTAEAIDDFEATLTAAENGDWANRLRELQPGGDD